MKAVVSAFNQEKALVGAFSVIIYEPSDGTFSSTIVHRAEWCVAAGLGPAPPAQSAARHAAPAAGLLGLGNSGQWQGLHGGLRTQRYRAFL